MGVFLPVDRFIAGDLMSVCDKTEQAGRKVAMGGIYHMVGQEKVKGSGPGKNTQVRKRAGRDGGLGKMRFHGLRTKGLWVGRLKPGRPRRQNCKEHT